MAINLFYNFLFNEYYGRPPVFQNPLMEINQFSPKFGQLQKELENVHELVRSRRGWGSFDIKSPRL